MRGAEGYVVGVVADGVSQSFYGHLAAKYLAEHLLEFLWACRERIPDAVQLHHLLRRLESEFEFEIDSYPIPEHILSLQRSALEEVRKNSGSQAVFAAFVLDAIEKKLRLFEVGDAMAVVHCARDETNGSHSKVIRANPAGRWSSVGRTELLLEEVNERDVRGVVIKSDGARDWGMSLAGSKLSEAAFYDVANDFANYDDVSFVAAVIHDEGAQVWSVDQRINVSKKIDSNPRPPVPPPFAAKRGGD